jgi:4-hydroxy-4-methyl-2-oxoglutarate aldolase
MSGRAADRPTRALGPALRNVVVTGCPRADLAEVDALAGFGVATVHEAAGRSGYLGPAIRPVHLGARVGGTAVTVVCWPGDNLMVHAAVEQCRPGDILVVTTTSPSTDGMFGELLAISAQRRGVRGLVTTGGVRDVAELRALGFPAFSAAISAQGTVKATAGAVNVGIAVFGQRVDPGDAVVADDDGVVVVPRLTVSGVLASARARAAREDAARDAFRRGELGLDRYDLRAVLSGQGVEYVAYESYQATP